MSDDLAEARVAAEANAVSRLQRWRAGETIESIYPLHPRIGFLNDKLTVSETAITHYLSTLTAPTPVTLDALKARGFSLNGHSNYGWYTLKELVWVKVDTRFPSSEWWWEDGHEDRIYPEPESMEEVEKLITRLSRPKPQ